jgi:hypothetical protein
MELRDFTNLEQWATQQWGQAKLGDSRRQARAIALGAKLAAHPGQSLPQQLESWGDLKAAYRLLNERDVTHQALSEPHWQLSREQARAQQGVVLFVQDRTELDYSQRRDLPDVGHIRKGKGRGLVLHNCLAVLPHPQAPQIIGLAHQSVWVRKTVKKGNESRTQRGARRNEADGWAETVESIGPAPPESSGTTWVSVADRESDVFSYIRRSRAQGWHCLVRLCQNRIISTVNGTALSLKPWVRQLPSQQVVALSLRGRDGQPQRELELHVSWQELQMEAPKTGKERHCDAIQGTCIRAWQEEDASAEPLEWILFTTLPIADAQAALRHLQWYGHRWLIEEYHKCLKSGCALEKRQLATADGLERLLGFLAIVAVKLLQVRTLGQQAPDTPAQNVVPPLMIQLVVARLNLKQPELSVRQFWYGVARLGGFLARGRDGHPGWQTLWRGWQRLQEMYWAAGAVRQG